MSCDICGKKGNLQEIRESFQTKHISHTCDDCSAIINDQKNKIYEMMFKRSKELTQNFIKQLRKKKHYCPTCAAEQGGEK